MESPYQLRGYRIPSLGEIAYDGKSVVLVTAALLDMCMDVRDVKAYTVAAAVTGYLNMKR